MTAALERRLPSLPELGNGVVKDEKLGELYDRVQVHQKMTDYALNVLMDRMPPLLAALREITNIRILDTDPAAVQMRRIARIALAEFALSE